jgi:FkbM family methyltransferase
MLRSLGYLGSIVSFEPVAATYGDLAARAAGDISWRTMPLALGSEDGAAQMNVTASSVLASLRRPRSDTPGWIATQLELAEPQEVTVVRLDSIFDQLMDEASTVFLKLDTQGWDLEVLSGATGCLDRIVAIQTEVSVVPLYEGMPTWLESMRHLGDLGYIPTWMAPVVFDGPVRPVELDCLFVRAGDR